MKPWKNRFLLVGLLALVAALAGCSEEPGSLTDPVADKRASYDNQDLGLPETMDIVDTAVDAGIFNTLVLAVQTAGLEDALRGEGPLTVFAPSDEAFGKLPEDFVAQLLEERNREKLQELLLYHVVAGQVTSSDLRRFQFTKTLSGKYLWIRKLWDGTVKVNAARVTAPDVMASNGVIHVIDKVLVPRGFELVPEVVEPTLDIVDTASEAGVFNTLLAAAEAAELVDALRGEDPLTVFAPTDEAFGKLPADLVAALLLPENKDKLQELLLYHVVSGQVLSGDLSYYQRVETLAGSKVRIVKWFGNVWVNWSRVTTPDVLATNGVIHVINRVLIPYGFTLNTGYKTYDKTGLEGLVDKAYPDEAPPAKFDLKYLEPAN